MPFLSNDNGESWKLVKSKEDIDVFVRKLDNETFKEVKIIGIVDCQLSELVASIEDVPKHPTWVTRSMESKILQKFDDGHFIYYLTMDMPFPVKDRELVIEYQRSIHPDARNVSTISNEFQSDYPVKKILSEFRITIPIIS